MRGKSCGTGNSAGRHEIMMKKGFCSTLLLAIIVAGCLTPAITPDKPIGKGYVNLCISDPDRQITGKKPMMSC